MVRILTAVKKLLTSRQKPRSKDPQLSFNFGPTGEQQERKRPERRVQIPPKKKGTATSKSRPSRQLSFDFNGAEEEQVVVTVIPANKKAGKPEGPGDNVGTSNPVEQALPTRSNYLILDENLGVGGPKTKFNRNIEAIRTLKAIEAENRLATPGEQEILSRYVGWGGLPQVFDERKEDWSREYTALKETLTENEYSTALASTLNAHYTAPKIARLMFETLERLGFIKGNILEPSCGIGNFFGVLPESMRQSKLYGVELDDLTGRIARQLYQNADITIDGFENTHFPDNFFDVAIGNVPFGSYRVTDSEHRYDRESFKIHDYFFSKAIDKVRPGGIIAFITSKWTLDKTNPSVREYLAKRAELLGAVRLPNNAFKANAGTEVTSDIIFLQKRDRLRDDIQSEEWLSVEPNFNGLPINHYFNQHPEMMLGTMVRESNPYRDNDTACVPFTGTDLAKLLKETLWRIQGKITEGTTKAPGQEKEGADKAVPADPNVRNFSYTIVDDELYYREDSIMVRPDLPTLALKRAKGMVELRNICRAVIDAQMEGYGDTSLRVLQGRLNEVYEDFVSRYGRINEPMNARAFDADSSYYLLCSLENLDENKKFISKADMFTKRTIRQNVVPTHAETAQEALLLSVSERACVDMPYMTSLTGKTREELLKELQGGIFLVPGTEEYQTADEYLSGNVRKKLEIAQLHNELSPGLFDDNITALEKAQPALLAATEIDVRLGSTWIDPKYIQDFMYELLNTPDYARYRLIEVQYSRLTSVWNITGKLIDNGNLLANTTYGTHDANAYKIIEDSLNLRAVKVYKTEIGNDGKEKRVIDPEKTAIAQQKQEEVKQKFRDWIFQDPERREILVEEYNRRFNSTRAREYDGSHLRFSGINPNIELRGHQRDAIARILYGGNTLLAHEVGAGKTYEMVAAAMEQKRLGLAHKSLFVVPNHLTEQWATETLRLYPGANILVATQKDFETRNRKKFCAKIATGDYDAIIIGHSQFEKIPISWERQHRLLQEQLSEIMIAIQETKENSGDRWSIKQMEATKKTLEHRLEKLQANHRKDDVVVFEELGVDRLFVDEAHGYKNLYIFTKMHNVAGVTQTEAQKSSDMFAKCRYMDELTGGRGVIFATGTPISNSMVELYSMQRYLQFDTLKELGLENFDAWASTFGETVTALELAPEGNGFRAKTRFSRFFNLPELMVTFKEVADIKTADVLDLPKPKAVFHTLSVKPTEEQRELVAGLSERASRIHNGGVDPSVDNMLKITTDGRKIGLDQRLIDPLLPDNPGSKINVCVENVYRIWANTQGRRLTQLIFCDFSTPGAGKGLFNVYDDIREKLILMGVPKEEIVFIHSADTEQKKKELFSKVRNGAVRILMGSTQKLGAGTNVQDRLIASHDLDCPWRPADLEQRAGRIVRQGNLNPEVHIYRYVTENTFDAFLYQTVEAKQRFISQIMTSKTPLRSCEDVDETVLSYAEVKALCIGDPRIREKMELDIDVSKLRLLEASFKNEHFATQDKLRKIFPVAIRQTEQRIAMLEQDIAKAKRTSDSPFKMVILGETFIKNTEDSERKREAGKALIDAARKFGMSGETIGEYRGFKMSFYLEPFTMKISMNLTGAEIHNVELGTSAGGNLARIDNVIEAIPTKLGLEKQKLERLCTQVRAAEEELKREFPRAKELQEKVTRLAQLNAELTLSERNGMLPTAGEEPDGETETQPVSHAPVTPEVVEAVNF